MFVILIPVFVIFKFDSRISLGCAILLLIFAAVLTVIKEENFTDMLVIYSYWLLVVGTCCYLIELFREKKWKVVE
jgi:drug/metabolite transporter (DMT)-like permease